MNRNVELRGTKISFGGYGFKGLESGWINSRQIEAARKTISNFIKREGKIWIRIFPDKPITRQAPEKTLGGGKGNVEFYVFPVKPGRVLFEMDGVSGDTAKEALRLAGFKLPVKTKIIAK